MDRFSRGAYLATGLALVLGFLILNPLFWLFYGSFWSAAPKQPGEFTFGNYLAVFTSADTYSVFLNSVVFGASSMVVAFAIGLPLSWLIARTNLPYRKFFEILSLLPYLIPGLVFAIGWVLLTSPSIGYLNIGIMKLLGLQKPPLDIYTLSGMSWLAGLWSVPFVVLIVSSALRNFDPTHDDAASVCGASLIRRTLTVTLPMIRPALVISGLIVFARMLEDFLFPAVVGLPARVYTFPTQIYGEFQGLQYGRATASSVLLLIVVAGVLLVYSRETRVHHKYVTQTTRGFNPSVRDLGKWKYPAFLLVLLYLAFSAVLPLAVVVLASVFPIYNLLSLNLSAVSPQYYLQFLNDANSVRSLYNSSILAVVCASIAAFLSVVVGYMNLRMKSRVTRIATYFSVLPLGFPGVVLAMGLLWGYIFVPIGVYGTIWILLIAYVTRFLPYADRSVSPNLLQMNPDLEDAAATCGAGRLSRFRNVILPAVRPGLASAWIIVAVSTLQELSVSVLLYSSGSEVAGVRILQLYDYNEFNELAAFCVIVTLVSAMLALVILRLAKAKYTTAQSSYLT